LAGRRRLGMGHWAVGRAEVRVGGTLGEPGSSVLVGVADGPQPLPAGHHGGRRGLVGRRVGKPYRVLWAGLLYAVGQVLAYVSLAVLLLASLFSAGQVSMFLQAWMYRLLGPVLILSALVLLGLVRLPFRFSGAGPRLQRWVEGAGLSSAFVLGALFAISFCPISAAWFFGGLIPVALQQRSVLVLPAAYGLGTALPVVTVAALLAFGAGSIGRTFQAVEAVEQWARRATGLVILAVGLFFSLRYSLALL